jgi:transposase
MHAFTERAAGERLFVDYAGATMDVVCPQTGEVRTAQLFVATPGASNYTYVEATWTQSLPDWIASHVRAFDFFGGVPVQVVPDNLKAGVTRACFYEPAINRTCADLAAITILPLFRLGQGSQKIKPRLRALF